MINQQFLLLIICSCFLAAACLYAADRLHHPVLFTILALIMLSPIWLFLLAVSINLVSGRQGKSDQLGDSNASADDRQDNA